MWVPARSWFEGRQALVAYATGHGSTKGVAERIAARLTDRGHRVEVLAAEQIEDVAAFDAVILGSPVYDGSWLPAATELVRREAAGFAGRPVWLYSVGSFGDRHRLFGRMIRREPREIGELQRAARPRDYRVFAGVIERDRWPLKGRLVYRALGGRYGDNRDWPEIDAWADEIARAL